MLLCLLLLLLLLLLLCLIDFDLLDVVRTNDDDDELVELMECCRDIERCWVVDDVLLDGGRAVITGGR